MRAATLIGLAIALGPLSAAAGPQWADELARLAGHRVAPAPGGYRIVDVAGEGAPLVGVVERRGDALWLVVTGGPAVRLRGPLAVPRIAGPGYKVWVIGARATDGSLVARRLGVLAPPHGERVDRPVRAPLTTPDRGGKLRR